LFGFQEVADELLAMPGRNLHMNSSIFQPKKIQNFLFLMFLKFKMLYLTSLVELRSLGFFGGSIDSLE
jgi:hypothetical protein